MTRIKTMLAGALGAAMLSAAPAMASEPNIYPYQTNANYCPAGYQPVSIAGVICCGQPNRSITYQQAMAHPVPRVSHRVYRPVRSDCPVGVKGCR